MSNYTHLIINKNRGWRGLAEARAIDLDTKEELKTIFSFSQAVWNDLISRHMIVMQDADYYYIFKFEDEYDKLPRITQQRSVLIKDFNAKIIGGTRYKKTEWTKASGDEWAVMYNCIKNRNNHTTSDWNYIGVRVVPTI